MIIHLYYNQIILNHIQYGFDEILIWRDIQQLIEVNSKQCLREITTSRLF